MNPGAGIKWLAENDPDFVRLGEDDYATEYGVSTPCTRNRVRRHESPGDASVVVTYHCARCRQRRNVRKHTVL